jgi:hypothetical protein
MAQISWAAQLWLRLEKWHTCDRGGEWQGGGAGVWALVRQIASVGGRDEADRVAGLSGMKLSGRHGGTPFCGESIPYTDEAGEWFDENVS